MLSTLNLPYSRGDTVQNRLLRSAAQETKWGLHADKDGSNAEAYHGLIKKLFASIIFVESHQERKYQSKDQAGIMYAG